MELVHRRSNASLINITSRFLSLGGGGIVIVIMVKKSREAGRCVEQSRGCESCREVQRPNEVSMEKVWQSVKGGHLNMMDNLSHAPPQ